MIFSRDHSVVHARFDELAILEKYGIPEERQILNQVSAAHINQDGASMYFNRSCRAGDLYDAYSRALGRMEAEAREEE